MPGTPRHKPENPRKPRPTPRPQTPSRVIHAHDEHPSRAMLLSDTTRSKTKICPGAPLRSSNRLTPTPRRTTTIQTQPARKASALREPSPVPGTPRHKPENPRKPRPTPRPQTPSRVIHAHDEHPSRAMLLSDTTRSKTKICPGAPLRFKAQRIGRDSAAVAAARIPWEAWIEGAPERGGLETGKGGDMSYGVCTGSVQERGPDRAGRESRRDDSMDRTVARARI